MSLTSSALEYTSVSTRQQVSINISAAGRAQGWSRRQLLPARRRARAGLGRPAGAPAPIRAAPTDVFVLDFDGVIVDSEPEVSHSALQAAAEHWPHLFGGLSDAELARVLVGLRRMRPRLVNGFESLLMARLVLEEGDTAADAVLAKWEGEGGLLNTTLARWGEREEVLAAVFDRCRATALQGDRERWLALNQAYPGVAEALKDCTYPWYMVSSKNVRRLVPILNNVLDGHEVFEEDSPRLYCSLIPPNTRKVEALRAIAARPAAQGATLHFIDDRQETLRAVVEQAPDLAERYKLYFATWGYCTPEELATSLPGVRPLSRPEFCELLRWAVIMGVDDGCEPTREEVLAGLQDL